MLNKYYYYRYRTLFRRPPPSPSCPALAARRRAREASALADSTSTLLLRCRCIWEVLAVSLAPETRLRRCSCARISAPPPSDPERFDHEPRFFAPHRPASRADIICIQQMAASPLQPYRVLQGEAPHLPGMID